MAHPRKHHTIPMEDGTALLIFESHCGDRSRIPDVVRFYKARSEFTPMDRGRMFAAGTRRNCCLVTKTTPGDLIVIAEPRYREARLDWFLLAVDEDFVPQTIGKGRKPTYSEIHEILSNTQTGPPGSLSLTNGDLRRLFQAHVPSWLELILSAQLDRWRELDPAAFVNFTPSVPDPGDLDRCITAAPYTMLERWTALLDQRLLARCIGLSPEGAVRYAFDKIPDHLRNDYLFENAAIALEHWQAELSETDWCICARALPKETFDLRMSLSTRKRACILATAYKILWMLPFTNPSAGERKEILESILEHPDVWLSLHQSSFSRMFGKLGLLASIRPGNHEIHSLMHHSNEEVKNRLHEYIAGHL